MDQASAEGTYETPEVTEYGTIESITETGWNKEGWGHDTDWCIIPLKGSF